MENGNGVSFYRKSGYKVYASWQDEIADRDGIFFRPIHHLPPEQRGMVRKTYLWYVANGIPMEERGEVEYDPEGREIRCLKAMVESERNRKEEQMINEKRVVMRRYGYQV